MGNKYDLVGPNFTQCPYPTLKAMSENDPVYFDDTLQSYFLTRYQDIKAITRDPRLKMDRLDYMVEGTEGELRRKAEKVRHYYSGWMVFHDGGSHSNIRHALSKAFSPPAVKRWREYVEAETDARLDAILGDGHAELVSQVIKPATHRIMCMLLGIEDQETIDRVIRANDDAFTILQEIYPHQRESAIERSYPGVMVFEEVFGAMIAERRATGLRRPDILDVMIFPEKPEHHLSDDVIISTCGVIVAGSVGTTVAALGCSILNLLDNPEQIEHLLGEPESTVVAVEELLRWESIALALIRVATEDVEVAGERIPAGSMVFGIPGPANRDPAVFDDPESMDMCRRPNRHLSFGDGPHFCLGAPYARLVMQVMIPRILGRLEGLTLTEPVEFEGWQNRTPKAIHASFKAG